MGAPIRNGDVKLGKSPGPPYKIAARTTTDNNGHFTFPAQPAGSYTIIVASTEPVTVTVQGAAGGAITKSSAPADSTAKVAAPASLNVDLKSDGKTPITGTVRASALSGLQKSQ